MIISSEFLKSKNVLLFERFSIDVDNLILRFQILDLCFFSLNAFPYVIIASIDMLASIMKDMIFS